MYTVLSLGGSIVIPKDGFDVPFLQAFRDLILRRVKEGGRFILVVGGGGTARAYQGALRSLGENDNNDLDLVGIHATLLNAEFIRVLFGEAAHKEVLRDPRKKVRTKAPIIVAGGWKPGFSTDTGAVLFAKTYGVSHLYNLSNIDYVFDKDPQHATDAQALDQMTWKEYQAMSPEGAWVAGYSAPFDPIATKHATKLKLTVGILRGTNIVEVEKALLGERFKGTVIHP